MRKKRNDSEKLVIEAFAGLNECDGGQTRMKPGESPRMRNFRVTPEGKLEKRQGWRRLIPATGEPVVAMWKGRLGGQERFLFVRGGGLHQLDPEAGVSTLIGSLNGTEDACLFYFGQALYLLTDSDYMRFDGQTLSSVDGYAPVLYRNTPPDGAGEAYEAENLLSAHCRQRFSPDGTGTLFRLCDHHPASIDEVLIDGEPASESAYEANIIYGTVTFSTAPEAGTDRIEVRWTMRDTRVAGRRARVTGMRRAKASGIGDSRMFLWGDPAAASRVIWSEVSEEGPTAEYFTDRAACQVGSGEFAVTDILRQYDRNLIFTERDAWYMTWEEKTPQGGTSYIDFPLHPLNDTKGAAVFATGCLIDNDPVTVTEDGVYVWTSTNVRDERNARLISGKVGRSFKAHPEGPVTAFDDGYRGEYWMCFSDGMCLVYQYRTGVWFCYDGIPARLGLCDGADRYFATGDGSVCRLEEGLHTDDGVPFSCLWEMSFSGFGRKDMNKNLMRVYVGLEPNSRASYTLKWQTNRDGQLAQQAQPIGGSYAYFGYDLIDYGNFTYDTLYTPQTFRHRLLVKRFAYIKLTLEHESDHAACTVLSLTLEGYPTSEIKE